MYIVQYVVVLFTVCFKGLNFQNSLLRTPAEYIAEEMARKSAERISETPDSVLRSAISQTKTKWFEQPLNHFNPKDKRKLKLKYYVDDSFWKANGPIFIYINGEVDASDNLNSLLVHQVAQDTNGLVIGTEHRYFGESMPPLNLSVSDNLRYLQSRQALADVARLIEAIKAKPKAACSKVIVAGASYAGNLAAWMRLIYPNLVYAAVSSSAPVLAKKNFQEFLNVVGNDFKKYGEPGCYEAIGKLFQRYDALFETVDGIEELKREKNICKEDDMSIPQNKQYFFFAHIAKFVIAAQLGRKEDIKQNCSHLIRNGNLEELSTTTQEKHCKNFLYSNYLDYEKNNSRFWLYLLCTEFGFNFISSANENPFTDNLPDEFFSARCPYVFGDDFDEQRIDEGVARTNKRYGGLTPPLTNVMFVNGEADPWSSISVLKPLPYNPTIIVIPGASHCTDIYYSSKHDPPEVAIAKLQIKDTIKNWVRIENVSDFRVCLDSNRDVRLIN